jgi:hypothetical protein
MPAAKQEIVSGLGMRKLRKSTMDAAAKKVTRTA